ncbi:MAG TPA: DUF3592 domain-containing protein [Terriglobales bacterium]|nr:DUF3592 domain-containing protein [Terriglobales bacterium]
MPGFGDRIRPDQVTFTMRARIARSVYRREFLALSAVFIPCLLIAGAAIAFYHYHAEAAGNVWQLIGPIVVTGGFIAVAIHVWGLRERKFVETAALAAAVVKEIETSSDFSYKHRVILSYRPIQYKATKALLPGLTATQLAIATVESNLPGFTQLLQRGDSLSILYDPADPDHVCIVEEEKAAEAMHPSAA